MSRAWSNNANPDGTRKYSRGIQGNEKEAADLVRKGFDAVRSSNGDRYYYSPSRGLLWLFPDNTWFGDRMEPGRSLDEYLNTIPDIEIEERLFGVVQIENGVSSDLGVMNGLELAACIAIRIGDESEAARTLAELAQKESIRIEYKGAFGKAATVEIHRMVFRPDTRKPSDLLPQKGDAFTNGLTVDYTCPDEGVVFILEQPNRPIPLGNVAPTKQPGIWRLVGIKSIDDERNL